jgi:NADPH-dependent ferric siderophore reductase
MRDLVVGRSELVTPNMVRLTLVGEALAGFTSSAPDDHIKVFAGEHGEERRDYTPRRFDPDTNDLVVDFAMHDAGPVTQRARNAKLGDPARIGGPKGSVIIPDDFDCWLLIGDETALPAIGRRPGSQSSASAPQAFSDATTRLSIPNELFVHVP